MLVGIRTVILPVKLESWTFLCSTTSDNIILIINLFMAQGVVIVMVLFIIQDTTIPTILRFRGTTRNKHTVRMDNSSILILNTVLYSYQASFLRLPSSAWYRESLLCLTIHRYLYYLSKTCISCNVYSESSGYCREPLLDIWRGTQVWVLLLDILSYCQHFLFLFSFSRQMPNFI